MICTIRAHWLLLITICFCSFINTAKAVPLFARQTGLACSACHFGGNFPELTDFGREFKLTGYTLGTQQKVPVAAMVLGGYTALNNTHGSNDPATDFADNKSTQLQQASLFTGGKITDNAGAFVQWTYDGVEHHSSLDNTDIRYAAQSKLMNKDITYGITLNNNPTVQDVFNTTPAWTYPYAQPGGAFQGYGAISTLIDGGLAQQVAGIGAYAHFDHKIYAELSGYQTADGIFSTLRAGQDTVSNRYPVSGTNPYWRLAYHDSTGAACWMVGAYGLVADVYTDPTDNQSPTNRYRDNALDAQYQYTNGAHLWSTQATWIAEKTNWDASTGNNPSDRLTTARIKGSYFYNNKLGASMQLFSTTGTKDANLYTDNTQSKPTTRGYVLEASYLPIQTIRLGLQYTGYSQFNGASSNYDNTLTGRKASDNNTLYFYSWFMF